MGHFSSKPKTTGRYVGTRFSRSPGRATLNYEVGNPHIDFDNSPFYVNTQLKEWEVENGSKRCAAVSSFGMSGTNAHLVIEEASQQRVSAPAKPAHLIVLSARGAEQLKMQVEQLIAHCQSELVDCGDMSYTLSLGRRHFAHRLACVVRDTEDLVFALNSWLAQATAPHLYAGAAVELREHGSLQRLGNQCIESCSQVESRDAYWEKLATIAELYVQGLSTRLQTVICRSALSPDQPAHLSFCQTAVLGGDKSCRSAGSQSCFSEQ
jgi:polyketide synthase PksM